MSVSIEGSGSITGVSTFNNATFSGITTFADNINFDANIAGVTTFLGVGVTSLNVLGVSTFTGQLNAGTISATTLSATTVSIAGTLTYQDVTNIDSVGVITARNAVVISEDNAIHFRGTAADDNDAILRASAGGGQLLVNSRNDAIINIDANNDSTDAHFAVAHGAATGSSTELLRVQENGKIGISSTAPKTDLDISQKTGAVALPQGTTAQRPTGSAPYIRKNTTNNALEYYDGTSWVEIITDYFPTGSVIFS